MNNFLRIFGADEKQKLLNLTDAKLRTDDECSFDVHRVLLSRDSDYFYELFCGPNGEDRRDFSIPGVSGESLSHILVYLYTGRSSVNDKNIADLMIAAHYLSVDGLLQEIRKSVTNLLNMDNSIALLVSAYQISSAYVYDEAFHFVQIHFELVVRHYKSLVVNLPFEVLKHLLSRKTLCVPDERPVWEAISEWVQKDTENRLSCVPYLLMFLARKEINEALATEILGHKIVRNISNFMIINGDESDTRSDILQDVIPTSYFEYRIPSELHIVTKKDSRYGEFYQDIYAMSAGNFKSWRKIASIGCSSLSDHTLVLIKHNLYMFRLRSCFKLDLKEKDVLREENITQEMSTTESGAYRFDCVIHIGQLFFFLGSPSDSPNSERKVKMFDPELNLWKDCKPCLNMNTMSATSISATVYVVGRKEHLNGMSALQYDTESDEWSSVSPPKSFPTVFIGYHEKLFLITPKNKNRNFFFSELQTVEIYDTLSRNWTYSADLPIPLFCPTAMILHDRLLVYEVDLDDDDTKRNILVLNEAEERWEEMDKSFSLNNLFLYRFCKIDDVETIRIMSKADKYRSIEWQRSDINWDQLQFAVCNDTSND